MSIGAVPFPGLSSIYGMGKVERLLLHTSNCVEEDESKMVGLIGECGLGRKERAYFGRRDGKRKALRCVRVRNHDALRRGGV